MNTLSDLRAEYEKGLEVVKHLDAAQDFALSVCRWDDGTFRCIRYFNDGEAWFGSVDYEFAKLPAVIEWVYSWGFQRGEG